MKFTCLIYVLSIGFSHTQKVTTTVPGYITNNIYFLLFRGPTADDYVRIKFEDGLTFRNYSFFDADRNTDIYFPGFGGTRVSDLENAFLKANRTNYITMDYSSLVIYPPPTNYPSAVINGTLIGTAMGQFFQQYIPNVQTIDKLHLLGHSMGAQIISKISSVYGQGKFKWLTGLDPAFPIYNLPGAQHLTKKDAEFVDIIHTDSGELGMPGSIGTVDFFPNLGRAIQPPCLNDTAIKIACSHFMSVFYYTESVVNPKDFYAKRCNWNLICNFNIHFCQCSNYNQHNYMGYGVDKNSVGDYFLTTSTTYPYGKGQSGVNF